jgi:hypothetical protein
LSGGRDFFESLVQSVNRLCSGILESGASPKIHGDKPELVQLQKSRIKTTSVDGYQQLAVQLAQVGSFMTRSHAQKPQGAVQMFLTTVQLFDLVEGIDQFLADRQTLPDLSVTLQPLPRRYRKADEPIAKRAAPAALGVTGLAVAAIAFFLVPVPQVREPKPAESQANTTNTASPNPNGQPQAASPTPNSTATPPSAEDLEKVLTSTPEIIDPTELRFLQRKLYSKLDDAWKSREQVSENLEYRVGVGKDGGIVGYKPVNDCSGRRCIKANSFT